MLTMRKVKNKNLLANSKNSTCSEKYENLLSRLI
jgi:hypothetical protein